MVGNHLRSYSVKVGEGREGDDYLITRLDHIRPALNVVNVYGENESRAGSQRIMEAWIRLKDDLDKIKKRGEMILIMGDMNRAIGAGRWGVRGNTPTVSPGGQMIREQLL